jgi:hypothetical protein
MQSQLKATKETLVLIIVVFWCTPVVNVAGEQNTDYPVYFRINDMTIYKVQEENELNRTELTFLGQAEIWNSNSKAFEVWGATTCVLRLVAINEFTSASIQLSFHYICFCMVSSEAIEPGMKKMDLIVTGYINTLYEGLFPEGTVHIYYCAGDTPPTNRFGITIITKKGNSQVTSDLIPFLWGFDTTRWSNVYWAGLFAGGSIILLNYAGYLGYRAATRKSKDV